MGAQPQCFGMFNHPQTNQWAGTFVIDSFGGNQNAVNQIVGVELASYYNLNPVFYRILEGRSQNFWDVANGEGWRLGALGNQDNHEANWGNANSIRTGVLAKELTREAIVEAYHQRRFYVPFLLRPRFRHGDSFDLRFFIKACHRQGIRVILDVVMNHARGCPLRDIAAEWYFGSEENRNAWGGDLFKYRSEASKGYWPARTWHYDMAAFWIREYHVDGFRIDEFNGISNWEFLRGFRSRAWAVQQQAFPGRPFIVIGEDSARRPEAAQDIAAGGKVTDSIWDFDFRDEVRRTCSDTIYTSLGKPSRSERVEGMVSGKGLINGEEWAHHVERPGAEARESFLRRPVAAHRLRNLP